MALLRIAMACLIGLSVATLPAAAGGAFKPAPQDVHQMPAMESMDDCCPPSGEPCNEGMDGCTSMAACVLKSFGYSPGASAPLAYPLACAAILPALETTGLNSRSAAPPFRPPRL